MFKRIRDNIGRIDGFIEEYVKINLE